MKTPIEISKSNRIIIDDDQSLLQLTNRSFCGSNICCFPDKAQDALSG
jgi:hypothetical protein